RRPVWEAVGSDHALRGVTCGHSGLRGDEASDDLALLPSRVSPRTRFVRRPASRVPVSSPLHRRRWARERYRRSASGAAAVSSTSRWPTWVTAHAATTAINATVQVHLRVSSLNDVRESVVVPRAFARSVPRCP